MSDRVIWCVIFGHSWRNLYASGGDGGYRRWYCVRCLTERSVGGKR